MVWQHLENTKLYHLMDAVSALVVVQILLPVFAQPYTFFSAYSHLTQLLITFLIC